MEKRYIVRLTDEERECLREIISTGKAAARKIQHAHILLKADADADVDANGEGWTDKRISRAFSVHMNTVRNIRQKFVFEGLEAALNRKKNSRPPRKRILDGEQEARLIALSCSEPPEGYGRWSLRLLADKTVELEIVESISHETVRRTLKKTI